MTDNPQPNQDNNTPLDNLRTQRGDVFVLPVGLMEYIIKRFAELEARIDRF